MLPANTFKLSISGLVFHLWCSWDEKGANLSGAMIISLIPFIPFDLSQASMTFAHCSGVCERVSWDASQVQHLSLFHFRCWIHHQHLIEWPNNIMHGKVHCLPVFSHCLCSFRTVWIYACDSSLAHGFFNHPSSIKNSLHPQELPPQHSRCRGQRRYPGICRTNWKKGVQEALPKGHHSVQQASEERGGVHDSRGASAWWARGNRCIPGEDRGPRQDYDWWIPWSPGRGVRDGHACVCGFPGLLQLWTGSGPKVGRRLVQRKVWTGLRIGSSPFVPSFRRWRWALVSKEHFCCSLFESICYWGWDQLELLDPFVRSVDQCAYSRFSSVADVS